ncbi:hypothetical protein QQ008_26290 [Fulvivirgaceae bacterium BMA10]|uniref:Uncharacterized protein n=1 Tax=Splendidivirga corallicola TaxID=3051826 RepID=A0ABT8KVW2_9BACT|nr:hypothetical protein [Fulvivirgaceae bacterium BMA10]
MKKKGTVWIDLYNCLYLVSSKYNEVEYLESPIFEIFDELDSSIINGLSMESLKFFLENDWITEEQKKELNQFKQYLVGIDDKYWNKIDFDLQEDWLFLKKWSISLMDKLGMKKKGWDSDGEQVIIV